MWSDFDSANKCSSTRDRFGFGRFPHRRVANPVFQHNPLAVNVKTTESSGRAGPARSIGCGELHLALDPRRVEQTESRGVEFQETVGPARAQVQVGGVKTNGRLVVIADAN